MKVLNLYAGIGGNRKLWEQCEVTAVENNPKIAEIYADFFPEDRVIIGDAHQYLLENYNNFDFIWSSPPCQSHSQCNNFLHAQGIIRYPDLRLYEEILFLKKWFKGKWVVENVKPYYEPLIKPQIVGRHRFWANFEIPGINLPIDIGTFNRSASIEKQKAIKKTQIQRNALNPKLGLHVLKCAFKNINI